MLFRYIQSKDAFEAYYKRFLAKRLLLDRSSSYETENHVLEKLKLECGHDFTKNLESMFSDIQISTDLNNEFKNFKTQEPRLPIHVKVIAQAIWPTYPVAKIRLPENVSLPERHIVLYIHLSSCALHRWYQVKNSMKSSILKSSLVKD